MDLAAHKNFSTMKIFQITVAWQEVEDKNQAVCENTLLIIKILIKQFVLYCVMIAIIYIVCGKEFNKFTIYVSLIKSEGRFSS